MENVALNLKDGLAGRNGSKAYMRRDYVRKTMEVEMWWVCSENGD